MNHNQPLNDKFDVAIVGAGIVGCAMARRFTLDGAKVVVLEKALDVLDGASKGNSAILHTGFDAPPASLEQSCIEQGYREYLKVSSQLGLPILKCGALVLAWTDEQLSKLPELVEKAHANGVHDVTMLERTEILAREPHLSDRVLGGFAVPRECLIDPWTSAHAYLQQAIANGASLFRGCEVVGGEFDGERWSLRTTQGKFNAKQVINCAGLYSDVVDERLMGETCYSITPRKGQFVIFDKAASALASSIILPVPTRITKGIMACRTIFGNFLVGPTAEDQKSRTDASTDANTLQALVQKSHEMIPALQKFEIVKAYAGLRPASDFQDYQVKPFEKKKYLSVGGIRSTGLSSALGIARHVSRLVDANLCSGVRIDHPIFPRADRLSDYHQRDWQEQDNGGIVCHCERVTRREIEQVMASSMPPATLEGLKRRTRVGMGRCQGFYCFGELAKLTEGRLEQPFGMKHERR